uniref:Uncharacterized protein n=1 Tax=Anguilla anguilla TaxID=7936 RepID=A0A0E9R4H3_ANGAN
MDTILTCSHTLLSLKASNTPALSFDSVGVTLKSKS